MSQGSVVLHFREILTPKTLRQVRERIVKESRMERKIHESLGRSSLSEQVVVGISPQTLNCTDPSEIYHMLTTGGMSVVSAGYGKQVTNLILLLNPANRQEPRVQMIAAYAQASLGRYFEAMGHISSAAIGRANLLTSDQLFLDHLRDVCEYHSGRIALQEYLRREMEWAKKRPGVAAAEHRLEVVRQERLRERDLRRRNEMLAEMQLLAAEVEKDADASPARKIQARTIVLSGHGDQLATRYIEDVVQVQTRIACGYPIDDQVRRTAELTAERWREWEKSARQIIDDAAGQNHPILVAGAMSARIAVYQQFFLFHRMDAHSKGTIWQPATELIYGLMTDAENAMKIYNLAGSLDGETRTKLLLADLFEAIGNNPAALKLAEEAAAVARAMGYGQLEAGARAIIEGRSIFKLYAESRASETSTDEDVNYANATDEILKGTAEHTLRSFGLPVERLQILEREFVSRRTIARERLHWCRHLQLIQDLVHEQHPSTHFAVVPRRACICEKFKYESQIEYTDADTVIVAFKGTYCAGCTARSPKVRDE